MENSTPLKTRLRRCLWPAPAREKKETKTEKPRKPQVLKLEKRGSR